MKEAAERWAAFAREDLQMAELALIEGIFNQVCFHSQQCAEKCLKALLVESGCMAPRTHSVADLARVAPDEVIGDLRQELESLDAFYVVTRYPDGLPGSLPDGLPDRAHAVSAISTARSIMSRLNRMR